MPKTRPPYPAEFRQQMVELVRAGGKGAGRVVARVRMHGADHHQLGWRRLPVKRVHDSKKPHVSLSRMLAAPKAAAP